MPTRLTPTLAATFCLMATTAAQAQLEVGGACMSRAATMGGSAASIFCPTAERTSSTESVLFLSDGASTSSQQSTSSASYRARAEYGDLGAYATVDGTAAAGRTPSGGPFIGESNAGSGARAEFHDVIHVQSSTLAQGAAVTLRFSGEFSFSEQLLSGLPALNGSGTTYLDASFNLIASSGAYVRSYCSNANRVGCVLVNPGTTSFEVMVSAVVGDTLSLGGYLYTQANLGMGASDLAPSIAGSATVDSYHSAHSYLDVLSADVQLVSASGTLYASPQVTPVPEPASTMLLASGLLGLGAAFSRRRPRPDRAGP